ncbi:D-alanyl-D-alanine carboxypeptidase [Lachnospiraceae bacterium OF09-6]|nr:D-alanyl-D-alanine carboxypeptidase [Lachnospiraceae bacterium OF09-6]
MIRNGKMCILLFILWISLFYGISWNAGAEDLELASQEAVLMEASTGKILFEKASHEKRSPASVTKIMTVLLAFEALENGQIHLEDEVVTSAYAKSMGGSQVFLEEGEKQTVQTLLKCILVSSGNDASVALAEYIAGSEMEFVNKMNEKAKKLGMNDTHFVDCCGLTDSDDHYTSANDIALMSRELITRFPEVFDYTTIWMKNITHVTQRGSSEFGLSNTNKLLRSYNGCNGLKTGSTSKALFCVSATALRNDIQLISVIMAGPDSKTRFKEAAQLLDYGFGKCRLYTDEEQMKFPSLKVRKGVQNQVTCHVKEDFRYLDTDGKDLAGIQRSIQLADTVTAPVQKGETAGYLVYTLDGKEIGRSELVFDKSVEKAGYGFCVKKAWEVYSM